MMSLTAGLDIARSALAATAEQTSVVSRNVSNAQDLRYTRKVANVVSAPGGGIRVASIARTVDVALHDNLIAATSASASQDAIATALSRLDATVGDPESELSPAALIGRLADRLQQYGTRPHDDGLAGLAVSAAIDLAVALNESTAMIQGVRRQADADIAQSVAHLNALLGQFETLNIEVVKGTQSGRDVTDSLDQRDHVLARIAEEIGIRTVARGHNDLAIYTDGGVTLFETRPRSITFQPTMGIAAGVYGSSVYADGVPVTGAAAAMPIQSGRIAGLAQVRDSFAVTYQHQLDEVARSLVEAFAESDQSAVAVLPTVPGLFTYPGAPAMPTGSSVAGLAGIIAVSANVDPRQGGAASRLRDGGIADPLQPAYVYNTSAASGFSARLEALQGALFADRVFDPAARLETSASVGRFAASSAAWLQQARQEAAEKAEYKTTVRERSSEALSRVTGVNLDEEFTIMLDLERSYQASSRLITIIEGMYDALIKATG